jgi:hypothetical protein
MIVQFRPNALVHDVDCLTPLFRFASLGGHHEEAKETECHYALY